jgi:hypothetical protein
MCVSRIRLPSIRSEEVAVGCFRTALLWLLARLGRMYAGRSPSTKPLARDGPGHSDRKRDPCVGFSSLRSPAAYAARRLVNLVRPKLYLLAG